MNFSFSYGRKRFNVKARKVGIFSFGLMFRSKNTDNLLFEFTRKTRMAFTSLFVFFPFIILWLDEKNKVIGFERVSPFTFTINSPRRYRKVLEIPINNKNRQIIQFFVGRQR